MAGKDFGFYDLTYGINYRTSDFNINQSSKKTAWSDAENVEFYKMGGIAKMGGNVNILTNPLPAGSKILGGFEYIAGTEKIHVFVYGDGTEGHFCKLDMTTGVHTILKSGLNKDAKCWFENFNDGVLISNNVDDAFMYFEAGSPSFIQTRLKEQRGVGGGPSKAYKGRIFMISGANIYFCGAGDVSKWRDAPNEQATDSGVISNFHNSSGNLTGLKLFGDKMALHRQGMVFVMTGSTPTDTDPFVIHVFGDKGASSHLGILNFENQQLFFDDGVFALKYGNLQQLQLSDEVSIDIHKGFEDLDTTRFNEIIAVPYPMYKQVWFYMPEKDKQGLTICWILDIKDNKHHAWYKRRATPVNCAWTFNGNIYTGTLDGKILQEGVGDFLDGEDFYAYWYSPFFTFGDSRTKMARYMNIAFDGSRMNDVDLIFRYNGVKTREYRISTGIVSLSAFLIWDSSNWDDCIFADSRTPIKLVKVPDRFVSIQVGVRGTSNFAFDGFTFFDVGMTSSR